MGCLKDVTRSHVYRSKDGSGSSVHILHPFTNSVGANRDKYALVRTISKIEKRSAHVAYAQLTELFAHDCFEVFNIRLRMKDAGGTYPSAPPGLHPCKADIVAGSEFDKAVQAVNVRTPLSGELKCVLKTLGVAV